MQCPAISQMYKVDISWWSLTEFPENWTEPEGKKSSSFPKHGLLCCELERLYMYNHQPGVCGEVCVCGGAVLVGGHFVAQDGDPPPAIIYYFSSYFQGWCE